MLIHDFMGLLRPLCVSTNIHVDVSSRNVLQVKPIKIPLRTGNGGTYVHSENEICETESTEGKRQ